MAAEQITSKTTDSRKKARPAAEKHCSPTQTPLEFKEQGQLEFREQQQFDILAASPTGNESRWYRVSGAVCQHFGVFRVNDQTGSGWSLTHLPSGRRIFAAVTEAVGRGIVERLLATGIEWQQPTFAERETTVIVEFITRQMLPELVASGWLADLEEPPRQLHR